MSFCTQHYARDWRSTTSCSRSHRCGTEKCHAADYRGSVRCAWRQRLPSSLWTLMSSLGLDSITNGWFGQWNRVQGVSQLTETASCRKYPWSRIQYVGPDGYHAFKVLLLQVAAGLRPGHGQFSARMFACRRLSTRAKRVVVLRVLRKQAFQHELLYHTA